jgi:hypothetical protein
VGAPGVDTHRGGLSADGRLGVIASVLAGEDPTLVFFTKREGAFSNGSLVGVYHVCQVFDSIAGVNGDGAFWGTATFNGAGGVTYSIGVNNDGTVPVGPVPIVSTYAVAADGALTLPISGSDFTGGVLAGGEIAFACGGESGGDVRALTVFVKQAAAASAATFSGPYHMAALEADVAPVPIPHWSTLVGEASADGAGTLTLASAAALGDHGLVTVLPPGITQPYTVAVDGTMTLATAVSLRGGITADGRFAVLAGGSVNTEDVQLFLFVR